MVTKFFLLQHISNLRVKNDSQCSGMFLLSNVEEQGDVKCL